MPEATTDVENPEPKLRRVHTMIDLETFGTSPQAMIRTIGAVKFDIDSFEIIDKFHAAIRTESALRYGRLDAGTLDWWLEPRQAEANARIVAMDKVEMDEALVGFHNWLGQDAKVWGNGSTFDIVILRSAYAATALDCPWKYKNEFCFRTVKNMVFVAPPPDTGMVHDAIADCIYQIAWLKSIQGALDDRDLAIF